MHLPQMRKLLRDKKLIEMKWDESLTYGSQKTECQNDAAEYVLVEDPCSPYHDGVGADILLGHKRVSCIDHRVESDTHIDPRKYHLRCP